MLNASQISAARAALAEAAMQASISLLSVKAEGDGDPILAADVQRQRRNDLQEIFSWIFENVSDPSDPRDEW